MASKSQYGKWSLKHGFAYNPDALPATNLTVSYRSTERAFADVENQRIKCVWDLFIVRLPFNLFTSLKSPGPNVGSWVFWPDVVKCDKTRFSSLFSILGP